MYTLNCRMCQSLLSSRAWQFSSRPITPKCFLTLTFRPGASPLEDLLQSSHVNVRRSKSCAAAQRCGRVPCHAPLWQLQRTGPQLAQLALPAFSCVCFSQPLTWAQVSYNGSSHTSQSLLSVSGDEVEGSDDALFSARLSGDY